MENGYSLHKDSTLGHPIPMFKAYHILRTEELFKPYILKQMHLCLKMNRQSRMANNSMTMSRCTAMKHDILDFNDNE